jgi:hypothetical protein
MAILFVSNMDNKWMKSDKSEYIDVHSELLSYSKVIRFFETIEVEFDVLKYCNGANAGGRYIFQILSQEFVEEVAQTINRVIEALGANSLLLEVMGGDGRLFELLKPRIKCNLVVTDSRRNAHDIAYPKWVIQAEALEAVREYSPGLVLMSWEPLLSSTGIEIAEMGIPLIWIGDPRHCGVDSGLMELEYKKVGSRYALGRRDRFEAKEFGTDIYLFNWL